MLSISDGVAIVVGIVIGSAIFETPSLVAANTGRASLLISVWILGAAISVVGALCYAELSATYPDAGGDYHFLDRAWGRSVAFLYGWARMTVIQTGSIALIAFVFGDYASQIFRLGAHSSAIYAAAAVLVLTGVHLIGLPSSRQGMRWLTGAQMAGLLLLIAAGFFLPAIEPAAAPDLPPMTGHGYREALRVLAREWPLERAIEVTARHTRQYARRQLSWFRRDGRIVWLDAGDRPADEPALVERALDLLRRMLAG